ncbi:hypothetical protein AB0M32_41915 [Streptomyces sp. NPDC051985]|uniref:hypothetical protein n=1 Tax=Streptomyces sp. NPDC051985 TaxID=3155807 RepID=UPI00341FCB12
MIAVRAFGIAGEVAVAGDPSVSGTVLELERQPGTRVVAGHDPEVMTRFAPHLPGTVCRVL